MKGGYQIIDFMDVNLTATGVTIPGIHAEIEGTYRKAILIERVTIEGVEKRNCFVDCEASGSNFTFTAYGKTFTIGQDDKVTIA